MPWPPVSVEGQQPRPKGYDLPERLPQKPDDALPDSTSPYGPCPRCGRLSNFTTKGSAPVTYDGGSMAVGGMQQEPSYDEQLTVLQCQGCRQNVVVIEEQYVGGRRTRDGGTRSGTYEWRGIHWWPTPGMRPGNADVPAAVSEAVAEATRCLAVQAPRAAAVMFRGALGQIVVDRGSAEAQKKPNLARQLKQMADEHSLDETLAEWADHLRTLGNAGAHPNELEPVTMDEAHELSRLMAALIDYLYVMPATVRRARQTRP